MASLTLLLLFIIFSIPLISIYILYLPPAWFFRTLSNRYPASLIHIPTTKPILALTIDDTPSKSTSAILEILCANDVHATFFVIGSYVDGREDVLRELVRQGNELANHAMHDEPSWKLEIPELRQQILQTQGKTEGIYHAVFQLVESSSTIKTSTALPLKTPPPPRYFRPGSGFFTSRMLSLLQSLSFRLVLGSIYPHDAQISLPWLNAWHILRGVRAGGIIICHDRPWTPEMLRRVLPELHRRGFRVGSVSEALAWAKANSE